MGQTETLAIEMPAMGESVTEGTVLEWHVAVGDTVAEGDTIVEVSTDKVDAEVPAPTSGTITKLLAEPDDVIDIGSILAEMEPGEVFVTTSNGRVLVAVLQEIQDASPEPQSEQFAQLREQTSGAMRQDMELLFRQALERRHRVEINQRRIDDVLLEF